MAFGGRTSVNLKQREALVQFMERFPPLALGTMRSREDYEKSKLMWDRIAKILNKIDPRTVKSGSHWAKYWADIKFKIRRKYATNEERIKLGLPILYIPKLDERVKNLISNKDGKILNTAAERLLHIRENYVLVDKEEEDTNIKSILKNTDDDLSLGSCVTVDYDEDGREMVMPTEYITFEENDSIIPDRQRDIKLETNKSLEYDLTNDSECNLNKEPEYNVSSSDYSKKSIEDIKKEILEFQLYKQKELFQLEKTHKLERHNLEMEILNLRRQTLKKQLQGL